MGRYYNGDIDGKFWFAVQSSDAPSRFGGHQYEPSYISYSFVAEEHLEGVEEELKRIEDILGAKMKVLQDLFERQQGYNDAMIIEEFTKHGVDHSNLTQDLVNYADYGLGQQIRQCLVDNEYCDFDAEI